jgi:hypothetical protein
MKCGFYTYNLRVLESQAVRVEIQTQLRDLEFSSLGSRAAIEIARSNCQPSIRRVLRLQGFSFPISLLKRNGHQGTQGNHWCVSPSRL